MANAYIRALYNYTLLLRVPSASKRGDMGIGYLSTTVILISFCILSIHNLQKWFRCQSQFAIVAIFANNTNHSSLISENHSDICKLRTKQLQTCLDLYLNNRKNLEKIKMLQN